MSTLRFKIKEIPGEGRVVEQAIARALVAEALEGVDADLEASHAQLRVELSRAGHDVFARGKLTGALVVPCAACLGPAQVPVDAKLLMTFVPDGEEASGDADPMDDADVATHDLDTIDLEPVVREQLILALPISARCREDCKGLCPVCGQNRNERDCGHHEPDAASALSLQLQKLNFHPKG
jgi:uncharacterized protein